MAQRDNQHGAMAGAKANGKKHKKHGKKHKKARAKRNGLAQFAMTLLKVIGSAFVGTAIAAGSALLLAKTSLSGMAQDGILIAEGLVLGGAAHALGFSMLGTAAFTATFGVAGTRMLFRQRADARVRQLVADATAASATATGALPVNAPAAAAPATAPSGAVGWPGPVQVMPSLPYYNPYATSVAQQAQQGMPAYG